MVTFLLLRHFKEKRVYLIKKLLGEKPTYAKLDVPQDSGKQKMLLRALLNVRMPASADAEFLQIQDEYLEEELRQKGVTYIDDLTAVQPGIYIWQGDISTLRCDAIVNAANSGMTGCYVPNHRCIDNCIHTFARVQLRLDCAKLMEEQDFPPPQASLTAVSGLHRILAILVKNTGFKICTAADFIRTEP